MGLLMLASVIVINGLVAILVIKHSFDWIWLLLLIILPLNLPDALPRNQSIQEFPYEAKVTLADKTHLEIIRFSSFAQNGSKITIDKYTLNTIHWTDFQRYNVIETPLTIFLTDNDNKFIYTDRETGQVFNSNNMATQP